jgi:hypothetical protein
MKEIFGSVNTGHWNIITTLGVGTLDDMEQNNIRKFKNLEQILDYHGCNI